MKMYVYKNCLYHLCNKINRYIGYYLKNKDYFTCEYCRQNFEKRIFFGFDVINGGEYIWTTNNKQSFCFDYEISLINKNEVYEIKL